MNSSENKNNSHELFSLLGIQRVVCVDDQYRTTSNEKLNEIIGICVEEGTKKIEALDGKIPQLNDVLFGEDDEIWKMQLRKLWEQLEEENKRIIYSHLADNKGNGESLKDAVTAGALRTLLNGTVQIQYQELSFSQWQDRENEYLKEESIATTLFLFDRDLSKEGGSVDEGIHIIKKILAKSDEATCGLLSHTFDADQEVSNWEFFSKKHQLDRDRFVIISKTHLERNKTDDFLRNLKLTVLNRHCKKLKNRVSELIRDTYEETCLEVEKLNIYDFEHIVFRSSYSEGIWEPDTLFRLHGLFQRDASRQKAKKDKNLHELTNKIRGITLHPQKHPPPPSDTSWKIRRRELYECESHINPMHMPLELGDIFEKNGGEKKFILLAQPCDLMVRADGKRKHTVFEAIMAEIEKSADKHKKKSAQHLYYKLSYFDENTGDEHYVNFNKAHSVKLCYLDLCVYQPDGSAVISSSQKCPDIVIPTWKNHFNYLLRDFEKNTKRYKELQKFLEKAPEKKKKEILSMVLPKPSNSDKNLFKIELLLDKGGESLRCNLRRVGRFCQPGAGEMLMQYARKMSRMAFKHDFARNAIAQ